MDLAFALYRDRELLRASNGLVRERDRALLERSHRALAGGRRRLALDLATVVRDRAREDPFYQDVYSESRPLLTRCLAHLYWSQYER